MLGAVSPLLFPFSVNPGCPTWNGTTTNGSILGFWVTEPKVPVLENESQIQETVIILLGSMIDFPVNEVFLH